MRRSGADWTSSSGARHHCAVSQLWICHERAPPLKEMDDLKGLDASTGPFLKLLCLDGECSGRLRAMLTEGDTILGSDVEAPK